MHSKYNILKAIGTESIKVTFKWERRRKIVTRNEANVKSFMTLIKCIAEFLVLVTNLIVYKRDRKKMKRKTEVR